MSLGAKKVLWIAYHAAAAYGVYVVVMYATGRWVW